MIMTSRKRKHTASEIFLANSLESTSLIVNRTVLSSLTERASTDPCGMKNLSDKYVSISL